MIESRLGIDAKPPNESSLTPFRCSIRIPIPRPVFYRILSFKLSDEQIFSPPLVRSTSVQLERESRSQGQEDGPLQCIVKRPKSSKERRRWVFRKKPNRGRRGKNKANWHLLQSEKKLRRRPNKKHNENPPPPRTKNQETRQTRKKSMRAGMHCRTFLFIAAFCPGAVRSFKCFAHEKRLARICSCVTERSSPKQVVGSEGGRKATHSTEMEGEMAP